LRDIHEKLEPLIQKECPYTVKSRSPARRDVRGITWVEPEVVCEVALSGWTEDAVMRQPVFLRLREDKAGREVVREKPLVGGIGG
jgi:bifunctional non-homologous end joining protein LigD